MKSMSFTGFLQTLESQFPVVLKGEQTYQSIQLHLIYFDEEDRGMGYGTDVMERIIAFSVVNRLSLELTPSKKYGGNLRKLRKFYKRLGFVKNTNPYFSLIRPCY